MQMIAEPPKPPGRILMLLENEAYPVDLRVAREATSLARNGYEVTVICKANAQQPWYEIVGGVRVYRYPAIFRDGGVLSYLWEYGYSVSAALILSVWILIRHGFDVIHAHSPPDLYLPAFAPYKLLGKRFIFDHHDLSPDMYMAMKQGGGSQLIRRALQVFEWVSCRLANHIIATNESYKRSDSTRCGASPDDITVVRNCPIPEVLRPHRPDERLAELETSLLVYVGLIGFQDGVDRLLYALASLRDDFERSDFRCVVVGTGAALPSLKELAGELNLDDVIEFAGFCTGSDLYGKMAAADICVAPEPSNSYNDQSTVIKLMEYMAFGKPIVAFDLPEHRVTASETALYAEANDTQDFARLIAKLMDDSELRQQLGSEARRRVETELCWEAQERNLLAVYSAIGFPTSTEYRAEVVGEQAEEPTTAIGSSIA